MAGEAGKGDAPRKGADHEKYAKNYEAIFGKKKKEEPKIEGDTSLIEKDFFKQDENKGE